MAYPHIIRSTILLSAYFSLHYLPSFCLVPILRRYHSCSLLFFYFPFSDLALFYAATLFLSPPLGHLLSPRFASQACFGRNSSNESNLWGSSHLWSSIPYLATDVEIIVQANKHDTQLNGLANSNIKYASDPKVLGKSSTEKPPPRPAVRKLWTQKRKPYRSTPLISVRP